MKVSELVDEINYLLAGAEEQSEEVLGELEGMYRVWFEIHCGEIPDFEIVNKKGQVRLIKEET